MAHFVDDITHRLLLQIGIFYSDIDNAIDMMRTKYNVVIYNTSAPFVENGKIVYAFSVKSCNPRMGWNGRISIYTPKKWYTNIYEAKRKAIRAAAQWILAHKCKKISIKSKKVSK